MIYRRFQEYRDDAISEIAWACDWPIELVQEELRKYELSLHRNEQASNDNYSLTEEEAFNSKESHQLEALSFAPSPRLSLSTSFLSMREKYNSDQIQESTGFEVDGLKLGKNESSTTEAPSGNDFQSKSILLFSCSILPINSITSSFSNVDIALFVSFMKIHF